LLLKPANRIPTLISGTQNYVKAYEDNMKERCPKHDETFIQLWRFQNGTSPLSRFRQKKDPESAITGK
jgi:hypothetical protein